MGLRAVDPSSRPPFLPPSLPSILPSTHPPCLPPSLPPFPELSSCPTAKVECFSDYMTLQIPGSHVQGLRRWLGRMLHLPGKGLGRAAAEEETSPGPHPGLWRRLSLPGTCPAPRGSGSFRTAGAACVEGTRKECLLDEQAALTREGVPTLCSKPKVPQKRKGCDSNRKVTPGNGKPSHT